MTPRQWCLAGLTLLLMGMATLATRHIRFDDVPAVLLLNIAWVALGMVLLLVEDPTWDVVMVTLIGYGVLGGIVVAVVTVFAPLSIAVAAEGWFLLGLCAISFLYAIALRPRKNRPESQQETDSTRG